MKRSRHIGKTRRYTGLPALAVAGALALCFATPALADSSLPADDAASALSPAAEPATGTAQQYTPQVPLQQVLLSSTAAAKLSPHRAPAAGSTGETVNVKNGEFDIELGDGDVFTIPGLPAGSTYVITEEGSPGWSIASQSNTTGVIQPNTTSNAFFQNSYSTGKTAITLTGTKKLDGEAAKKGAYSFQLIEGGNVVQTATTQDGGGFQFTIDYTEAGTHAYQIKEVAGSDPTINYDSHTEDVTVEVTDDGKGALSAKATYDDDGVAFKNTTKPGSLSVKKTVTGTSSTDKEFTAHIVLDDAKAKSKLPSTVSVSDGTTAALKDNALDLKLKAGETKTVSGLPAGTTYTVTETDVPAGYTEKSISNGSGTIAANATATSTIANEYASQGSATLQAKKKLKGNDLGDGQFTFELKDSSGKVLQTASNASNGDIGFEPIAYTKAGTYTYTIDEVADPADTEHVYDSASATATVKATDDGDGHITTSVSYTKEGKTYSPTDDDADKRAPVFTNGMTPGTLEVEKTWADGTNSHATHATELDYTLANGDGSAYEGPVTGSIVKADGTTTDVSYTATKGKLSATVTLDNGAKLALSLPRDVTYTVSEKPPTGYTPTWTSTDAQTVTDTSASGTVGKSSTVSVTNTYRASGVLAISATKTLSGGKQLASGEFRFDLIDDTGEVIQTATNDADGTVSFAAIPLDGSNVGQTLSYQMVEEDTGEHGVSYDKTRWYVTATVSDDGKGGLAADVKYSNKATEASTATIASFENTFKNDVDMPLSGGAGLAGLIGGLGAAIAAAGAYLWRRRGHEGKHTAA